MSRDFRLLGCCLGNGTTVCNAAVEENGDYKMIAHISNGGRIKWYIKNPHEYVPATDMKIINGWKHAAREKFKAYWQTLPDLKKYEIMLNAMDYTLLLQHDLAEQLKACTDLHEKVQLLEKIYFENYI